MNQFYNILTFFDVLPNCSFTRSETMGYFYFETWVRGVAKRIKTEDLRKLGNIRKLSNLNRMIDY